MKPTILLLSTGGTISMVEDTESKSISPKAIMTISSYLPALEEIAQIRLVEAFDVPSPHMTIQMMEVLRKTIMDHVDASIQGIVITHGTDTLEETAYFLDCSLDIQQPIVITGAMRSSNEVGSDGLYNIISAVRVAVSEKAKNRGVLVVFNDEIHAAKDVTKSHASNVSTFRSPLLGPIGFLTKQDIQFHHGPEKSFSFNWSSTVLTSKVPLLKVHVGIDESILEFLHNQSINGLVIEAFGQGNVPPNIVPALQKMIKKNIPIVLVSRCSTGVAEGIYDYQGGGKQLEEMGVIFSNGLNGQKARIKLLFALANTHHIKEIKKYFQQF